MRRVIQVAYTYSQTTNSTIYWIYCSFCATPTNCASSLQKVVKSCLNLADLSQISPANQRQLTSFLSQPAAEEGPRNSAWGLHVVAVKCQCCAEICLDANIHKFWRPNIWKTVGGKGIWEIAWSRDWWRHVTPKSEGRDLDTFGARWSTYRKWHLGYQKLTCPMMSRDAKNVTLR